MKSNNTHAICNLAACPIRAKNSDESEMVSQLLFGDFVTIIIPGKPWIKIKNFTDGYEGWMDFKQLTFINEETFIEGTKKDQAVVGNTQLKVQGPFGELIIFAGSTLPFLTNSEFKLGHDIYYLNEPLIKPSTVDFQNLIANYLNAPYLWGGKSVFGIDCSGLTQIIFKCVGVIVPRDASEQVNVGKLIKWENRCVNDLVFYTTTTPTITHVGILVDTDHIIHAHGRVRIDTCDQTGIYNKEQEKYTHKYHSIKRWL